jgi:excisionase family DNA binding protein
MKNPQKGDSPTTKETEKFLTVTQTADYLQLHPGTVRRLIRTGELKALKLNGLGQLLIPLSSINSQLIPAQPEANIDSTASYLGFSLQVSKFLEQNPTSEQLASLVARFTTALQVAAR